MRDFIVASLNKFQARSFRKTGNPCGWRERLFFAVADRLVPQVNGTRHYAPYDED